MAEDPYLSEDERNESNIWLITGPELTVEESKAAIQILGRIANILPREEIIELYTSKPELTGGKEYFPYFRIDQACLNLGSSIQLVAIGNFRENPNHLSPYKDSEESYNKICKAAMAIFVWVDIGFENFEALYDHFLTRNWSAVQTKEGYTAEDIIDYRMSALKMYVGAVRDFLAYRSQNQSYENDCFSKNPNLKALLSKWQQKYREVPLNET